MSTSKSRIYTLLSVLVVLGYSWILANIIFGQESELIICPIKLLTGFPCPSCGATRSVMMMFNGEMTSAIKLNPIGILVFLIMLILPIWLIYDFTSKKETLWTFYNKIETIINDKKIAIPLILLVIANWIWNIGKGL